MRMLLQMSSSSASNDKGNAVAIVLLVLAVTSLIGVGMLTQSRIDVKSATSLKSYTTTFNLADGAASLALAALAKKGDAAPMYEGAAVPLLDNNYVPPPILGYRGTYLPLLIFRGPITDPTMMPGEDLETRTIECWTVQGSGKRRDTAVKAESIEEVRKGRHMPSETAVLIPVNKSVPRM